MEVLKKEKTGDRIESFIKKETYFGEPKDELFLDECQDIFLTETKIDESHFMLHLLLTFSRKQDHHRLRYP